MRKIFLNAFVGAALCVGLAHAEVVVQVAPPRAIVEHRYAAPSHEHVWIGGYHRWDGRTYVWEPGRWERPPRPHAVWVGPRWRHRHAGWVFVEGYWR